MAYDRPDTAHSILDYVSSFRERLHTACELARSSLSFAQSEMKIKYDRKALSRSCLRGDRVLVLLPVVGSCLQAKFSEIFWNEAVERRLFITDDTFSSPGPPCVLTVGFEWCWSVLRLFLDRLWF